jgi:UDP-glucuronate 4-epimerase
MISALLSDKSRSLELLKQGGYMSILVTGVARFIGFQLIRQLVAWDDRAIGIDNLYDCYSISLKRDWLKALEVETKGRLTFLQLEFADMATL